MVWLYRNFFCKGYQKLLQWIIDILTSSHKEAQEETKSESLSQEHMKSQTILESLCSDTNN